MLIIASIIMPKLLPKFYMLSHMAINLSIAYQYYIHTIIVILIWMLLLQYISICIQKPLYVLLVDTSVVAISMCVMIIVIRHALPMSVLFIGGKFTYW